MESDANFVLHCPYGKKDLTGETNRDEKGKKGESDGLKRKRTLATYRHLTPPS